MIAALAAQPLQAQELREHTGGSSWPSRGVYFFMESGEFRSRAPQSPRIVRVGTHAVSSGATSTLWGRLRAHRGGMDGRGNHRGSIFRLHVGAALLESEGNQLATWGIKTSAPGNIRTVEAVHEKRVSAYIGRMSVVWVQVPDAPGPGSARSLIEKNAIALLSNRRDPVDPPSASWLGRSSPREEIARSGLWNLNYVDVRYDPGFLDVLERHVSAMTA